MKYFKQNRAIGSLFALSSIFLAVVCFTITNTFAYPEKYAAVLKKWDVKVSNASASRDDVKVNVFNEKIDFNVILEKSGDIFYVNGEVSNSGSFNALLNNIDVTSLNNAKVGTSVETGITYYLSDYVDVFLKYAKDNKNNLVYEGNSVNVGDLLGKHTKNEFVVSLNYRDESSLSEGALVVLRQNVGVSNGGRPLRFSMSVGFNYIENTK